MKILITGGAGFLGTNLSKEVLQRGHELIIFDNLSRFGSFENIEWLKQFGAFNHFQKDIRNPFDVENVVKETMPDVIFHLAGQVAMTTSLKDPREDFEINTIGGLNLLEAVRKYCYNAIVTFSSTNKVYGDLTQFKFLESQTRYEVDQLSEGFDEKTPLNFSSPYGCSKGAVDQYMQDYARIYGIKTVVFRHSSIFGGRQFSTVDQGWIGWFMKEALRIKSNLISEIEIAGNGKQVRDVLFADDLIDLYFQVIDTIDITKGNVYNVGGGSKNSISIIELIGWLENKIEKKIKLKFNEARVSDQKVFISNNQKLIQHIGWAPKISKDIALESMFVWAKEQFE
jgi:CDP-paratose 2-epimerase